jgi:molybdenum cofactor cytidylyltransferase
LEKFNNIAAIILAAGSSSRLGQSKQLVQSEGVPLLLKTTLAALDAGIPNIIVVLGAHHQPHKELIAHLPVEIVLNEDWELGMGRSLKTGLLHLRQSHPQANAAMILVCDQPRLSAHHLNRMMTVYFQKPCTAVASAYDETTGVPVLFDHTFFPELLKIDDASGARTILRQMTGRIEKVDWPEGKFDVDSPDDLKFL